MTPEQGALIRASWQALAPHRDAVAATFYERLFALDPHAAALLAHVEHAAQRRKFMDSIDALLRVLDDPFRLVSEAIPGGRRHAGWGVRPRDYAAGGQALLAALAEHLGDGFTPEVREAWRELYTLLAAVMQRAGQAPSAVGGGR